MVATNPYFRSLLAYIISHRLFLVLNELKYHLRSLLRYPVESKIRLSQERLLSERYPPDTKKLIIFLTSGYDVVNGGILSISSIYEETKRLEHKHGARTVMCTVPGDPRLLKYTKFQNQNYIYGFSESLSYFEDLQSLMIHIPEISICQFLRNLTIADRKRLNKIRDVHLNIMIQNIEFLYPRLYCIRQLRQLGKLTCTTAHERYSTRSLRGRLGFPLHRLSTYVSSEQYKRTSYRYKENLMIVSNDVHPRKSEVLGLISKTFPHLRIQVVENLTYEDYKRLITRCKWALTFGEGLDGYFVETIFSGGISFSVFNSKFFTDDFQSLSTLYDSYDTLLNRICSDIHYLDDELVYVDYQKQQYELCQKHYRHEEYIRNLELFYEGQYT